LLKLLTIFNKKREFSKTKRGFQKRKSFLLKISSQKQGTKECRTKDKFDKGLCFYHKKQPSFVKGFVKL